MGGNRLRSLGALIVGVLASIVVMGAASQADASEIPVTQDSAYRAEMVTTPTGEVVIAWQKHVEDPEASFGDRIEVWTAVVSAQGLPQAPERIHHDVQDCTLKLEVDEDGNVVVGFQTMGLDGGLVTALKPAGKPFKEAVQTPLRGRGEVSIADGKVGVVSAQWKQGPGEGIHYMEAAVALDGRTFGPATTLDEWPAADNVIYGSQAAIDSAGELTAVWAVQGKTSTALRAAHVALGGVIRRETIAEPQALIGCPQMDNDAVGRVVVAWAETSCGQDDLNIATKLPGGEFGAPQTLVRAEHVGGYDLSVSGDGLIQIGYSDSDGLHVISTPIGSPLAVVDGPDGQFHGIASHDSASAVVHRSATRGIAVSDLAPSGEIGRTVRVRISDPWPALVQTAPIRKNKAAVLDTAPSETGLDLVVVSLRERR